MTAAAASTGVAAGPTSRELYNSLRRNARELDLAAGPKCRLTAANRSQLRRAEELSTCDSQLAAEALLSDSSLFGVAPPRGMEPRGLMKIHQQRPGALYGRAVESLGRSLGVRGGAKNPESAEMWASYLTDVVHGRVTDLPVGRLREMRITAAALAKGAGGDHKSLLDILAELYVSPEARTTGHTSIALGLELVEDLQTGLASPGQIRIATNELNRTARHQGNIDRFRRRP